MHFDELGHGFVGWLEGKLALHELLGVQIAMPVVSSSKRRGQSHTSCIDRLPNVVAVDATRDFLNEHGRNTELP